MKLQAFVLGGLMVVFTTVIVIALFHFNSTREIKKYQKLSSEVEQVFQLKFGHDMPVNSAHHIAAVRFANVVNRRTQKRVEIKIFPDQELGTDQEMIEMARAGKLDIILPPTAKLSTLMPTIQLFDLPFLFPDRHSLYEQIDGKVGLMVLGGLVKHGLVGASIWESGFKQFTANKRIRKPSDFKGLNIRIMKSRIIFDQYKMLGSNPIPIGFYETYKALKDGVVDGQENPLGSIVNRKFYEVQSHLMISNHAYLGQVLAFSKTVFEKLPIDIRQILVSTAKEVAVFQRNVAIKKENEFLDHLRKSGIKIYSLTNEERNKFRKVLNPLVSTTYREIIGGWLMDAVVEEIKNSIQKPNDIIIGLDADMMLGSAPSGIAIKRGIQLAIDEINQKGGVLGRQLKLIVRNHSGISARGIENIKHFSKLANCIAVVGGLHSPVALSELKEIHKNKMIYLGPWAAATGIVSNSFNPNYVFRLSVRDEFAGEFLVNEALKRHKNVGLLLENTGWGRSNKVSMLNALKKRNIEPVVVEWFNWGERDMVSQLNRLKQNNIGAIILVANAPEGITVVKNMILMNMKVPVISHWGITGGYFWEELNNELEQIDLSFLQTYSFINNSKPKVKEFINKYKSKFKINNAGEIIAPVGTAHAYDLVHILVKAVRKAKSVDRTKIRDMLERLSEYNGLIKKYSSPFTPQKHDALNINDFIIAKFNKQGHIVQL